MSVRCRTYALHLTLTASWQPTRSGELFNCKHPDYRAGLRRTGRPPGAHSHSIRLLPAVRTKLPEAAKMPAIKYFSNLFLSIDVSVGSIPTLSATQHTLRVKPQFSGLPLCLAKAPKIAR